MQVLVGTLPLLGTQGLVLGPRSRVEDEGCVAAEGPSSWDVLCVCEVSLLRP